MGRGFGGFEGGQDLSRRTHRKGDTLEWSEERLWLIQLCMEEASDVRIASQQCGYQGYASLRSLEGVDGPMASSGRYGEEAAEAGGRSW